jgi:N-acetylneuraminic acid mutarotase
VMTAADLAAGSASWAAAGSTQAPHGGTHTGTALPGGDVLVAGGYTDGDVTTAAADRYNAQSGTWTAVPDMSVPRSSHTATRAHNGAVVVAGGYDQPGCWPATCDVVHHASAEAFDPTTATWNQLAPMASPRSFHDAVLLHNGRVLLTGGFDDTGVLSTTVTYRPSTDTWSTAAPMATPRFGHAATRLHNGTVLVSGGFGSDGSPLASAEVYDPITNTWASTGPMSGARGEFTATRLYNGAVLVAGGIDATFPPPPGTAALATAETYDPKTGTWMPTGAMTNPRLGHVAAHLLAGSVLVAGGEDTVAHPIASAEVYDPARGPGPRPRP